MLKRIRKHEKRNVTKKTESAKVLVTIIEVQ